MNHPLQLHSITTSAPLADGLEADAPGHPEHSPIRRLRRLLRGRWTLALLVAAVWSVSLAYCGYHLVQPEYASTGMIEVKPYVPRVMFRTEDSSVMPMFDRFIASQAALMQSPRVLDQAMEDPRWSRLGRGLSPEARQEFRQQLSVTSDRASNIIRLSFRDADPAVANAAVGVVIDAYMRIYGERDAKADQERFAILEERRSGLIAEINTLNQQITQLASEYGSQTLEQMYNYRLQEMHQLETALQELELALVAAGLPMEPDDSIDFADIRPAEPDWSEMTVRQLAALDEGIRALLQQQQTMELQVRRVELEYHARHPELQRTRRQLELIQTTLAEQVAVTREEGPLGWRPERRPQGEAGLSEAQARQLWSRRTQLRGLHARARERALALGRQDVELASLREQRESTRERMEQTKHRIEQLNVESSVSGRIEVISRGTTLPTPINAGRRRQVAAAGGAGGWGTGFALVLMLGWRDRRLRTSDDAGMGLRRLRMLGLLPQLPDDLDDPANAMVAGYSVHHIRTMLQLGPDGHDGHVFAVTSPAPRSGKTSLTLALGLSFASAGCRTLLIDCDLGGGGLTHRMQAIVRRRLGQILQHQGLLSAEQLQEALEMSRLDSRPLGATLVEMGLLNEDDLQRALNHQQQRPLGLLDAIQGIPLHECTASAWTANLTVLPIGLAQAQHTAQIAPARLRQVFDDARSHYDVVLVDTGPVPGAVETAIAASAADQTVLVLSRGEQRPAAEKALGFLESIGARIAGVVFNRADARDVARAGHLSSVSARSGSNGEARQHEQVLARSRRLAGTRRLDPLTRAVAAISGSMDDAEP